MEEDNSSRLLQKTLTDMDIAMFCFPKSQPPEPYNCSLVSMQLLRLLTPVESNALIEAYPRGMDINLVARFMGKRYDQSIEFFDIREMGVEAFDASILPGFATLLQLYRSGTPNGHTIVMGRSLTGQMFIFDPQTGMVYSNAGDGKIIRSLAVFIQKYGFDTYGGFRYTEERLRTSDEHLALSKRMDEIVSHNAFLTFYKRGTVLDENIKSMFNLDIEMRHGRGRKTRKRKGVYGRRTK